MRFCLITYGSRGDVQPFIALSLGLLAKGYEVTLAAPGNFKNFVEGYGIEFFPLHGDAEELVSSPECLKVISSGNNTAFVKMALKKTHDMRGPLLDDIYEVAKTADALIVVNTCVLYASAVAEKLGIKWYIVQLNPPMIPTRAFPMMMFKFPNVSWLNPLSYKLVNNVLWQAQKKDNAEFRQRLDLKPLKGTAFQDVLDKNIPMIHAFSPEFISRPADWASRHTVAGFLSMPVKPLEKPARIPEGLEDWIKAGDKPLYIGFGSIPFPDRNLLARVIEELLAKTSTRVIYCTGWSPLMQLKAHQNLFVIDQVDHGWLMPQCSAALIHGGIGTVSGVIKAGIPAIVASIFVDQPVWGKIVAERNIGVHIPWRKLSFQTLTDAMEKCAGPEIQNRVKEVSQILNSEDGVTTAINTIESYQQN